jgi:UDP-glucose 4-epimerase
LALPGQNILITGGAGFIGSHLVDALILERPKKIVVVDNLFLGKRENLDDAVKNFKDLHFIIEDAGNMQALQDIIKKYSIDIVFNLAVIPLPKSLEDPAWTIAENIKITTNVCEVGRMGLYKRLIHFSSSEAYGSAVDIPMIEDHPLIPSTPYAASKLASDYIALSYFKTFGLPVVVIRPFNNYGPRQNEGSYAGIIPIVIKKVQNKEPIEVFGDGEQTRDFLFVKETARAAARLSQDRRALGRVVNIASGKETSINALVSIMLQIMGLKDYPVSHIDPRPGDVRRHCGGIALAQELIGFKPEIPLQEGLRETIDWYRKDHPGG